MARRRILIIEDNIDLCNLLGLYLRAIGYESSYAENSSEGIRKALKEKPHVIITDLNLPDVSGIEATELLKQNPATASIPVIMLTAASQEEWKLKALRAGVALYLVKPIALPQLIAALRAFTEPLPMASPSPAHFHRGAPEAR